MPKRILITGSAGYLGSKLVDLAKAGGEWEIFGIDIKKPANIGSYAKFVTASVTDVMVMQNFFIDVRPDAAVHLAFVVGSTHDTRLEESVAIIGSRNFLNCCEKTAVSKVVFLSSAAAYGAHDDNDRPLTEKSWIRGVKGYGYSRLKGRVDLMAQEFMIEHKACSFVILRPCLFVGPNTGNNFFDVLKFPVVPRIRDEKGIRDPEFQFIHEDDMARCLLNAVEKPVGGIFNVAGEGSARFSELIRSFGKRSAAIPAWLIYPLTAILWKLHLVTSPPAQLDFIRYPWIMDISRMLAELYTPQKTSIEAFEEFVRQGKRLHSVPHSHKEHS